MENLTTVKWGFIGCGEVTEKKSGPAFGKIEGSQVVAVMSRDAEKARSYAERHHIGKYYADAQSLVSDPEVNAVYIATPPSSHATFAIMAMKAGKPAYIEKPLAASYEDCLRVNRISELTGIPCFVRHRQDSDGANPSFRSASRTGLQKWERTAVATATRSGWWRRLLLRPCRPSD